MACQQNLFEELVKLVNGEPSSRHGVLKDRLDVVDVELNDVGAFRDSYVRTMPGGEILQEYYEVAPQIVAGINKAKNRRQVYLNLYEQVVSNVKLIQSGENGEVLRNYSRILNELKQRYLYTRNLK